MKLIFGIFILFITYSIHAQSYHGYVENETKEVIYGAKINCGTNQIVSDWNGRFELKNVTNDTVTIQAAGYEEQKILLSKLSKRYIHITLRAVAQEIKTGSKTSISVIYPQ
jgi:hypothetical protein